MRTIGLLLCGWLLSASCLAAIDPALLKPLASEDSDTKIAAIAALAQAAPEEALPVLKALADNSLALAGERLVIVAGERAFDAASNSEIKPAPVAAEPIGINNRVRRELSAALAALRLFSSERDVRWQAAQEVTLSADAKMLPLLDKALAAETDPEIKTRLLGRVFTGLSLGSILLLAALGLAITYGVMGVINMAHGELLMVGAYSAYACRACSAAICRTLDWYLLAAIPVAFLAAALVGVAAGTHGDPLALRPHAGNPARHLGPVADPDPGGARDPVRRAERRSRQPELDVRRHRAAAQPGAAAGTASSSSASRCSCWPLVWALMNKTRSGMFVRAVTQNRPWPAASACRPGASTPWPSARRRHRRPGRRGPVADRQRRAGHGPGLHRRFLHGRRARRRRPAAGAVWAALGLGVVTKFLEGWSGAVIAKIVVLVFIIIFIQKRPQGLFALKGRFVEN
jgi:urea transport system permease protein